MKKNFVRPSDCFIVGPHFGSFTIYGSMLTLWVSINAEFYVDFENINFNFL
jgi:hypothetical protein